jgi:uncharacterized protein (TIGR01777 family)
MRIVIAGGTGLLGRAVADAMMGDHEVIIVTRRPEALNQVSYDSLPIRADAVVNFAGDPIPGFWTKSKKRRILDSRVEVTHRLVDWMLDMPGHVPVFVSASAVGIYGDRPGETLVEDSEPDPSRRFRSRVCLAWEGEANRAAELGVRTSILRVGNVLSLQGGLLTPVIAMSKVSPVLIPWASKAMLPWVAIEDVAAMVRWLIETPVAGGAYNCTAPEPLPQGAFFRAVAKRLGRTTIPSPPPWLMRMIFGDLSEALIESQDARPAKALRQGFQFRFQSADEWLDQAILGVV